MVRADATRCCGLRRGGCVHRINQFNRPLCMRGLCHRAALALTHMNMILAGCKSAT